MAIGVIFEAAGVTQAQYQQTLDEVAPENQAPFGMLYHAAGPSESGFCVIEVWESQELMDRFVQEKLGAALQRAGINVQPRFFEVSNTITP